MQNSTLSQLYTFTIRKFSLIYTLLAVVALSACSSVSEQEDRGFGVNSLETELYAQASDLIESSQYTAASQFLQTMEARFPFGAFAEQGQLDLIYSYYQSGQIDAAIATADRFIRLHPEHPDADYAYYMRGLISFDQENSFVGDFLPLDITKRDPGSARESFGYFSEFLARFPDSEYVADSRKRMIYLRNILARHERNVANYYFGRGAYLAATNRGRYVVENFQGSPAVPDGLAIMAQGYTLLGMTELAQNSIDVLEINYPEHPALDEEGDFIARDIAAGLQRSWVNKLTFGILDQPEPLGYDTRDMYNPSP